MERRKTHSVWVGSIEVGGNAPIRIQSMTTSPTADVEKTVSQIMVLADRGCDLVRVTVQGKKEALACEAIKGKLLAKGYEIPLIADVHFYPPAALLVADFVDKVRINPGNFADPRAQLIREKWDEKSYQLGKEKMIRLFSPLVEKCKKTKKAMRIGVNHGSLSDRIMNRYGDTPKGMVESAVEYLEICQKHGFDQVILSMKSSNPASMIAAYRMLVDTCDRKQWTYPLHIGVTEAGGGAMGRIKSSLGIGSLLLDGIGDTIRVSLTEDPWEEIPVCLELVDLASSRRSISTFGVPSFPKRKVFPKSPLHPKGNVWLSLSKDILRSKELLQDLGCRGNGFLQQRVDAVYIPSLLPAEEPLFSPLIERGVAVLTNQIGVRGTIPLIDLHGTFPETGPYGIFVSGSQTREDWDLLLKADPLFLVLEVSPPMLDQGRVFFDYLVEKKIPTSVVLAANYYGRSVLWAAAELGGLLIDGYGEGLWIESDLSLMEQRTLSFHILQAARLRSSQTEMIACPGCGRTQFALQERTKRLQEKVGHLADVKVAVMGCIVNGPGEMADADFGYVGSGRGKVDLYIGRKRVLKGVSEEIADEKLIDLIQREGLWKEKKSHEQPSLSCSGD